MLEKPKLFLNPKEFFLTLLFFLFLILLRLFFLHLEYLDFRAKPFYYTDVNVIQAYQKFGDKGNYTVLKVDSPSLGIGFFTTSNTPVEKISKRLRLKLFPTQEFSFANYLGRAYLSSKINHIYRDEQDFKKRLLAHIERQHQSEVIATFYNAIYFATPLDKNLREQVSALGVSHLMALSGFHLAILSTILFFLLRPLYRVFQKRYFPYRFDLYDVGLMVLMILAIYVWFVGSPPSLLRSYAMMLVAWILLVLGMQLLSFTFLSTITLVLILIFPQLLLSLAFWFSVAGVFYIFLLIRYFGHLNHYLLTLLINFAIFILMLPLIHMVFPMVTPLQLLSPILSLLFSLFYPISMLLHLTGFGSLLDQGLLQLFTLSYEAEMFRLSLAYGLFYLMLSLLAIRSKWLFYLLLLLSCLFAIALFTGFLL
jgi:competence protein ComEC